MEPTISFMDTRRVERPPSSERPLGSEPLNLLFVMSTADTFVSVVSASGSEPEKALFARLIDLLDAHRITNTSSTNTGIETSQMVANNTYVRRVSVVMAFNTGPVKRLLLKSSVVNAVSVLKSNAIGPDMKLDDTCKVCRLGNTAIDDGK